MRLTIDLDAAAAAFYTRVAESARLPLETVVADALFKLAGELSLEALRKRGYRLFAISNTNPLMFHSRIESNFRADGKTIRDYFDGIVTSFEEGACKPDPLIFNRLMNRYALRPDETLLFDDSPANVEGARRRGLNAVRVGYTPQDDMLHYASLLK